LRIATSDTSAPNPADFTERRQPVLRRGFTVLEAPRTIFSHPLA